MDGKVERDYGGNGQGDSEIGNSSPKDCQQNYDLSATVPHSEIQLSQVEDEYSNNTSLALTDESSQSDFEDHNLTPSEMDISGYSGTDQPDAESENTGENMTIYEDNTFAGNENVVTGNKTQAVPECSGSTSATSMRNTSHEIGDNLGCYALLLGRLDHWIAKIDEHKQNRCDETERHLQANLSDIPSLELQEKFGIAETQIELINQILEETKKKGERK